MYFLVTSQLIILYDTPSYFQNKETNIDLRKICFKIYFFFSEKNLHTQSRKILQEVSSLVTSQSSIFHRDSETLVFLKRTMQMLIRIVAKYRKYHAKGDV